MNRIGLAALAAFTVAALAPATHAEDAKKPAAGPKPAASPGWVVVEESWWYPLRFDSVHALDNARYHYRRHEEKAAAGEIRKAVSWLKYASSHALPITKASLDKAASELTALAADLEAGKITDGARLDAPLARASRALAEWHFYKAKESYGKSEAGYAVQDLEAAVAHLEHAASSAHFQFGPDTLTLFEGIRRNGRLVFEKKAVDNDLLGKHLDGIEKALGQVVENLNKSTP